MGRTLQSIEKVESELKSFESKLKSIENQPK